MNNEPKKEWLGEHGYCNCLLTTMCRVPISSIAIKSNEQAPNLMELAATKEETREWLKTQEFDYESLNSMEIIKILGESAGISLDSWGKKTAELDTYVVGYTGKPKLYTFSFELKEESNILILHIKIKQP
jgi:hypothetical protein